MNPSRTDISTRAATFEVFWSSICFNFLCARKLLLDFVGSQCYHDGDIAFDAGDAGWEPEEGRVHLTFL